MRRTKIEQESRGEPEGSNEGYVGTRRLNKRTGEHEGSNEGAECDLIFLNPTAAVAAPPFDKGGRV